MKTRFYSLLLTLISCGLAGYAQTETYVVGRMGVKDAVSTYHYLELQQQRGRWIFPDFVYIDFSKSDYREAWAGAGLKTFRTKHVTLMNGGYFDAALGRAASRATYLLPWAYATYQLNQRIDGDAYYLVYLPLNNAGTTQHVLERVKLERDFGHFKLGGGYGGYESTSTPWQNRPFLTTTFKAARLGDFELWLQRLPANKRSSTDSLYLDPQESLKNGFPRCAGRVGLSQGSQLARVIEIAGATQTHSIVRFNLKGAYGKYA